MFTLGASKIDVNNQNLAKHNRIIDNFGVYLVNLARLKGRMPFSFFCEGWMPFNFLKSWMPFNFLKGWMPFNFCKGWMPFNFLKSWMALSGPQLWGWRANAQVYEIECPARFLLNSRFFLKCSPSGHQRSMWTTKTSQKTIGLSIILAYIWWICRDSKVACHSVFLSRLNAIQLFKKLNAIQLFERLNAIQLL